MISYEKYSLKIVNRKIKTNLKKNVILVKCHGTLMKIMKLIVMMMYIMIEIYSILIVMIVIIIVFHFMASKVNPCSNTFILFID